MKDRIHNVQETPDVLVLQPFDLFPHPDPRMRPAQVSIRIPALFWRRVSRHIERCRSSAERILWEHWLRPEAVAVLLSLQTTAVAGRGSFDTIPIPETAVSRLYKTLEQSLRHPLALLLPAEQTGRPASPAADPMYLLVLTNGATLVLRIPNTTKPSQLEAIPARIDDCFFSRAAADFARFAGDLHLASSSEPAGVGADAGYAVTRLPDSAARMQIDDRRVRNAVVREWVVRYAIAAGEENSKGLVPPDRPCDVNGDGTERAVRFLLPTAWGFSGGAHGCVWAGFDATTAADASGGPGADALRRMFEEERFQSNSSKLDKQTKPAHLTLPRHFLPLTDDAENASALFDRSRLSGAQRANPNDALACLPELTRAMDECHRAFLDAGAAPGNGCSADAKCGSAYRSAVALGRCRLLGACGESAEITLAPAVAVLAARELAGRLRAWVREAHSLPGDLRGATSPRAADLCLGLLEARLEAWAAYVAIDESYSAAVDTTDASAGIFSDEIDQTLDGLQSFDDAIQSAESLVASVAVSPDARLLDTWRELLAAPYRQSPPWWLQCHTEAAIDE